MCARLKGKISAADLVKIRLLTSKNWGVQYLLCVIDVFTNMHGLNFLKNKNSF